ncbi:MAG: putative binding-protein-dependent transport protein [Deltaproteobacteria bacterium]|nr:putative binding-protein-dependent transport protein [Deltaproteobacteria bacterium]
MMKRIVILLAAMAVLVTFGLSSIEAQDTVKIGYLTPLTGPGSLFGLTGREGFTLGVEDVNARGGINGKKLEPIVYDSQSKPTVAATLAQRLILEDKVPLIVVASGSVDVLAIMEVTERAKIPVFVCGSSSPVITEKGFKWVWRRSFNDKVCAEIIGKYVSSKPDWKRIAILSENSDYGKPPSEMFSNIIKQSKDKQVVALEIFNRGDTDLSGQLMKIKKTNPDVLVSWGYHTEHALIARQQQQVGMKAQIIGNSTMIFPEYIKLGGPAAEGAILVATENSYINPDPRIQAFVKRFEERYHHVPGLVTIDNYDGATTIAEVLKATGPVPEKIQNALNTMTFQGVAGPMKFDEKGQCIIRAATIARVEGGKHKFLQLFKPQ